MHEPARSSTPLARRRFCALSLVGAALLFTLPALAGSYLDRVALLIGQATREADYLHDHLSDKELAAVVHRLAVARQKGAARMQVPKEVTQAHPHVLLVLENYERAADAAMKGQTQRFFVYHERARQETKVLEGVLKQLGWSLPKY